jgi:uncharacterized protein (DUF2147 family)
MKLRLIAAFAVVLLTAGAAYSASDSDATAPAPATPPKHDKAAPKADKEKAAAPKTDKDKGTASKSDKDKTAAKPPSFDHKTAAGFWEEADDEGFVGAWFYFAEKKGLYEGRIVKAFKKPGAPEYSNLCEKCEGDQKDAPMLGLTIVKGMKRDGRNYEEGSIMDPRDGSVYNAQMELSPDGKKLSVRGYLGISLLGQTQVWNRLPDDSMAQEDIPPESFGPSVPSVKDTAKAQ